MIWVRYPPRPFGLFDRKECAMTTQNQIPELYATKPERSWRVIAEEASTEPDGKRLLELTNELLDALFKMDP